MKRIVFVLLSVITMGQCIAQGRLILYLQSYPLLADQLNVHQLLTIPPAQAINRVLQQALPSNPVGGVFATYAGFVEASSPYDGGIIFPRKHQKELFYLIVTKQIEPVLMLGKTVHHWELLPSVATKTYRVERQQDSETKLYFWQVTHDELADNRVPTNGIVLFANPHDVHVSQGISLTENIPQLEFPPIYINEGYDPIRAALRVLQVNHFFRLVRLNYKAGSTMSWDAQIIEQ